jgi:hypothetical protein
VLTTLAVQNKRLDYLEETVQDLKHRKGFTFELGRGGSPYRVELIEILRRLSFLGALLEGSRP